MVDKAKKKGSIAKDRPQHKSQVKNKKGAWLDDLGESLAEAGLRIQAVGADGNCFFRSCCDQMQGNEHEHMDLRVQVVDFMRQHPDDFSPYMEDDEDFTCYCNRMCKVAFTRLKGVVLCIHQAGQPCWTVRPDFPEIPKEARAWHLSYHDGEHYNSVRLLDDYGEGPAKPINIAGGKASTRPDSKPTWEEQQINEVKWGTGCENPEKVAAVLQAAHGDTEKAIETLIEEMATGPVACTSQDSPDEAQVGPDDVAAEPRPASSTVTSQQAESQDRKSLIKSAVNESSTDKISRRPRQKERLPPRGRPCTCGSGKKYRNCCGARRGAVAQRKEAEHEGVGHKLVPSMSNLFI